MYATYFGLRELPFNNTPDPRFFFATPDHEEALASLVYAVQERKGCVLLTGEVGAGKTLVTRLMLRHFGAKIVFAHVHHAIQSAAELMESVCAEFEINVTHPATPVQRVRALHDFLLRHFSNNTPAVLVLDEAQNLPVDAFEQLRMIGNLEADDAKLLQMVIVGQPELRRTFASHELRQLRQRIFRAYHLGCMDLDTTVAYLHHRLQVAGATSLDIFDASASEAIHRHSRGLPRVVNTICDNAMLSAYAADRRMIDGAFIENVVEQMMTLNEVSEANFKSGETGERASVIARETVRHFPSSQTRPRVDALGNSDIEAATSVATPSLDGLGRHQVHSIRTRRSKGSTTAIQSEVTNTIRSPNQVDEVSVASLEEGPLRNLRKRLEVVLGELGRLVTRVEGSVWSGDLGSADPKEQPTRSFAKLRPPPRGNSTPMDRLVRLSEHRRTKELLSSRT